MSPKPGFRTFVSSFRGHWLEMMSGGFSVPFTALAMWYEGWQQIIFAVLAVLAGGFTAYRIWAFERERVCELEEKLRPKVKVMEVDSTLTQIKGQPTRICSIKVYNDSECDLDNVLIKLEDVNGPPPGSLSTPVGLQTDSQIKGAQSRPVNLRAQEWKKVPIVYIDKNKETIFVIDEFGESHHWRVSKLVELTIGIYGGGTPNFCVLKVENGKAEQIEEYASIIKNRQTI